MGAWLYDISHPRSQFSSLAKGSFLGFAAYILAVVVSSVLNKHKQHSSSLTHLCILLTLKTLVGVTITFLPASDATSQFSFINFVFRAWDVDLSCTFASWLIVVGMPRGLPTHFPEEKLYSRKTLATSGPFPEENVSTESGEFK